MHLPELAIFWEAVTAPILSARNTLISKLAVSTRHGSLLCSLDVP